MGETSLRTGALCISAAAETLFVNCHICELERLELTGTKGSKEAWRGGDQGQSVPQHGAFQNRNHC